MSKKPVVILGLLVLSLVVGVLAGNWFYGLYERSIPEALKATTSMQGTRIVFWMNGLGLGVVTFLVALVALLVGRYAPKRDASGHTSSADVP